MGSRTVCTTPVYQLIKMKFERKKRVTFKKDDKDENDINTNVLFRTAGKELGRGWNILNTFRNLILNDSFQRKGKKDDNGLFKKFRDEGIAKSNYLWQFRTGQNAKTTATTSNKDGQANKWHEEFKTAVNSKQEVEMWFTSPNNILTSVLKTAKKNCKTHTRRRLTALAARFERVREYQSGNINNSDSLTV